MATEQRLASVSLAIDDVRPEALLRMGASGPRGFWAREGRWFAHLGALATVKVRLSDDAPRRFRRVWERARSLLSCSWRDPGSPVHPPPPRLFGGFSFRDDHAGEDGWGGFALAHFVLPEVELMGGDGNGVLTLRALFPASQDPDQFRSVLRGRLQRIHEDLMASTEAAAAGHPWVPATRSDTDATSWAKAVGRALEQIDAGGFSKVVLARAQTVVVDGVLDSVEVLLNLWRENSGSHVFLFEPVGGRALLGAAPETVATVADGVFRATAVAGSIARGRTDEEQSALARRLLRSTKDRREHQVCVEDMVTRLEGHAERVRSQEEPHVLTLTDIQHLETVIEAELRPGETVLSVLEDLHPTPAVCGQPRDRAMEFLRREEPFQRGWYAGPVGWFDGDGNGVFVPALRVAVGGAGEWKLFAGAGIVAGSDPVQEWDETRIKFQPALKALSGAGARRNGEGENDSPTGS